MPLLRAGLAVALACSIGLGARSADAAPRTGGEARPGVLVWPMDGVEPVAESDTIVRAAGFEPVDAGSLRTAVQTARQAARSDQRDQLDAVQAGLEAAQRAWLEQRFTDMVSGLQALQARALPTLGQDPYCATLWELEFRMGLGLRARGEPGDEDEAADRFDFAVALDPQRTPERALFGPDVAGAYAQAAEAVRRRPPRPVRLTAAPKDATLHIDCRPVDEEETVQLRPGLHVVHAVAPGRLPWAQVIDTRTTEDIEVALPKPADPVDALGRSMAWIDLGTEPAALQALAEAAAAHSHADAIVVLERGETGVSAQAITAAGKGRRVQAPGAAAATREALAWLHADASIRMFRPGAGAVELVEGSVAVRRPMKRPAVWGTVAGATIAVALALGLGLGLGLRAEEPSRFNLRF